MPGTQRAAIQSSSRSVSQRSSSSACAAAPRVRGPGLSPGWSCGRISTYDCGGPLSGTVVHTLTSTRSMNCKSLPSQTASSTALSKPPGRLPAASVRRWMNSRTDSWSTAPVFTSDTAAGKTVPLKMRGGRADRRHQATRHTGPIAWQTQPVSSPGAYDAPLNGSAPGNPQLAGRRSGRSLRWT